MRLAEADGVDQGVDAHGPSPSSSASAGSEGRPLADGGDKLSWGMSRPLSKTSVTRIMASACRASSSPHSRGKSC
eukprot:1474478-Pyramimonas_sp.AAC.1